MIVGKVEAGSGIPAEKCPLTPQDCGVGKQGSHRFLLYLFIACLPLTFKRIPLSPFIT